MLLQNFILNESGNILYGEITVVHIIARFWGISHFSVKIQHKNNIYNILRCLHTLLSIWFQNQQLVYFLNYVLIFGKIWRKSPTFPVEIELFRCKLWRTEWMPDNFLEMTTFRYYFYQFLKFNRWNLSYEKNDFFFNKKEISLHFYTFSHLFTYRRSKVDMASYIFLSHLFSFIPIIHLFIRYFQNLIRISKVISFYPPVLH